MREKWAGMKVWKKTVAIVGAFVVVVIIIGAIAGGGGEDDQVAVQPTPDPVETPATEPTPDPDPPPDPAPAPEPADTGRMSQGEWEEARAAIFDVNGELRDYTEKVAGECGLIVGAGQVAEALDCIDDAYDGVEGSMGLTYSRLDDLRDDVGAQCLRSLTRARNVVDRPLYRAAQASKRALDSLDSGAITATVRNLTRQRAVWADASGDALEFCAPE